MKALSTGLDQIAAIELAMEHADHEFIVQAGKEMKKKMDEYLGYYIASQDMFLAAILDPRIKYSRVKNMFGTNGKQWLQDFEEIIKEEIESASFELDAASFTNVRAAESPVSFHGSLEALFPDENDAGLTEWSQYFETQACPLSQNPFDWWKDNEHRFPIIAKHARKYLVLQPTSVESERLFSSASNLVTAKRTRLNPRVCQASLCLRSWMQCGVVFDCHKSEATSEEAVDDCGAAVEPHFSNDEDESDSDVMSDSE